jgi:hypothetical protein
VDGVHFLLDDAALLAGFICLGAPKDHVATTSLRKLGVILWGGVCRLISLVGRLLGLALLAEGAMDVSRNGGTIFEEVLRLSLMERAGGLERLLKVLRACAMPQG